MTKAGSGTVFALIICASSLLIFFTINDGHNWGDDFSAYIMQAQSIIDGTPDKFVEANRFTVENSSFYLHSTAFMRGFPTAYPWGFPLLLAPFVAIFGINLTVLKSVGVMSFIASLFLIWFGFRKYHSNLWRLVLISLIALNPVLLNFLNNIISDIPFMFFSTFTLLFIGVSVVEKRFIVSPVIDNIALGLFIAFSFFIRSNGILLLLTLAFSQLFSIVGNNSNNDGEKKIPFSFLPYASFLGVVLIWRFFLPEGGTTHLKLLHLITFEDIRIHIARYLQILAIFFKGVPFNYLLYCASIPLVIVGLIKRFRSDYHIFIYLFLTFSLYVVFPTKPSLRYLFPVIPFYLSFMITGIEKMQEGKTKIEESFRKLIFVLPLVFILSYFSINSLWNAYENIINNRSVAYGPFTSTAKNMFSFIKENTESDSIIIFFRPRVMRMQTDRRSIIANKMKESTRGDYLCVDMKTVIFSQMPIDRVYELSREEKIRLIYKNSEFRVYRINQ